MSFSSVEKLGPSLLKLVRSFRQSDIFPEAYVRELSKLQSNVLPLPTELVMEAIEAEALVLFRLFSEIRHLQAAGSVIRRIELVC